MKTLGTVIAALLLALTVTLSYLVADRADELQPPRIAALPVNGDVGKPAMPQSGPAAIFDQQIVTLGDFTGGSDEGGQGDANWTALVGSELSASRRVRVLTDTSSGGGTGYVTRGTGLPFTDQVSRLVSPATDVVIVSGSRNDIVAAPADVRAAAAAIYRQIAAAAPEASLIVIGPTWIDDNPPSRLLSIRDAVASAAAEAGATFLDPIAEHWFTARTGMVGKDSVNPTDAGHRRIAELVEPVILSALERTDRPASATRPPGQNP